MSTPANIAKLDKDGTLHVVNVAMDGYPEQAGAGNVLLNAYTNPKKIDKLMKLGNLAHVGFTNRQANALKEAGANWDHYIGIGSPISGKDYKGRYTSPAEAKANMKTLSHWQNRVNNYTKALQRDYGRGRDEAGQATKTNAKTPQEALKALDNPAIAPYEDNYNYVFDSNTNQWYMNSDRDPKARSLKSVVPQRDFDNIHKEYLSFQKNPVNPKINPLSAEQIHKKIHHAIYFKGAGLGTGLNDLIHKDKDRLRANAQGANELKARLHKGSGLTSAQKAQLQHGIRLDTNSKTVAKLNKDLRAKQAQVKNLQAIDKYVAQNPDTKLYPNDLMPNRKMGKKLQSSVSPQSKELDLLKGYKRAMAQSKDGMGEKYLEAHPQVQKALKFRVTPQHEVEVDTGGNDFRTPTQDYLKSHVSDKITSLSDKIKDINHIPRDDYGKYFDRHSDSFDDYHVNGIMSGAEALRYNSGLKGKVDKSKAYRVADVKNLTPKPLSRQDIIDTVHANAVQHLQHNSSYIDPKNVNPNDMIDENKHEDLFKRYSDGLKETKQDRADDAYIRQAVPHNGENFAPIDVAQTSKLKAKIFPKHAKAFKLYTYMSQHQAVEDHNQAVVSHEKATLGKIFPNNAPDINEIHTHKRHALHAEAPIKENNPHAKGHHTLTSGEKRALKIARSFSKHRGIANRKDRADKHVHQSFRQKITNAHVKPNINHSAQGRSHDRGQGRE